MVNMQVLAPSRKKIRQGDIFALSLDAKVFYFGCVIYEGITFGKSVTKNGGVIPGWPNCTFCYIYRASSSAPDSIPTLKNDELLIAPFATNHLPWRRGYFKTVANKKITVEDVLQQHCFYDWPFKSYRDLDGNILPDRTEPCGVYGLRSFRTIDDSISKALGVPPAPD